MAERLVLGLKLGPTERGLSRRELFQELERLSDESRNRVTHWLRDLDPEVEVESPEGAGRSSPVLFVTCRDEETRGRLFAAEGRHPEIQSVSEDNPFTF